MLGQDLVIWTGLLGQLAQDFKSLNDPAKMFASWKIQRDHGAVYSEQDFSLSCTLIKNDAKRNVQRSGSKQ